ncbi:MAG TPA: YbhB/YbcL family Raf kinase inhibitor-like protein [Myxococcota bacterium]|nr:YbhB/YbcL family Raf kinase inhibitor-like protein [Myxococcota bacterium]
MSLAGIALALAAGFALHSSAFADHGAIPARFTCEGEDVSPPLAWSAPPRGTRSLALVVDDPDAPDPAAPKRTWVHWVVYALPPTAGELAAGAKLAASARAGTSDFGAQRWRGPCPPIGRHRYFFKLYALDLELGERGALGKAELEKAIEGHVLARAELVGSYEKAR